ncbi:outer membrane beta-barrel protein [Vibrio vulnificus]|uniref:outer membrane beta-barrel protein n=1 Tax=Vibrio vulnificus TaxID=672 RepID=UPI001CDC6B2E|nr:outer membrane beta-barrel protein [Vibrio vulnificus]MCA3938816.1 outer membrane beta-barrel protein [Vibrio vulnificus]
MKRYTGFALGLLPVWVGAVEPLAFTTESGIEFIPTLHTYYRFDDNIAKQEAESSHVSTIGVKPALLARIDRNQYKADFIYVADFGRSSDEQNDYLDHKFQTTNYFTFNHRNRLVLDYQFRLGHETRGEGLTEGEQISIALPELITFQSNQLKSNYVFGAIGSQGRLEFGLNYLDKTFTKYENGTSTLTATKYSDFRTPSLHGEFYYRLRPETYWLVGSRLHLTEYLHERESVASRDGTSTFVYTGVSWEITGKTKGTAKLGYQIKEFDDKQRATFEGLSWDIGLSWQPQEHTTWTLLTTQAAVNPEQDGDYNLQTRYSLQLDQAWNSYFVTSLKGLYQQDDYTGSYQSGVLRKEERFQLSAEAQYQFRRWARIDAAWQYQDKTSNWSGYSFDQHIWTVTARLSL